MKRSFLFLQGPIGPFFKSLGYELAANGHDVFKINFISGDRYYWEKHNAADFKGPIEQFEDYVKHTAKLRKVTDLIVYGDCRPVHKIAIDALKSENINIHVFEEGYFRPNWVTLELNGVNNNSSIPRDPKFYKKWQEIPQPNHGKLVSAYYSMCWQTLVYYLRSVRGLHGEFKNYNHHFGISPHVTMGLWVPKFLLTPLRRFKAAREQKEILKRSYFIAPLQLCRDYQIKSHSQFEDMPQFIEYVTADFAKNANKEDNLVFKAHPLDNHSAKLKKAVFETAAKYNIEGRVRFIDGGHLPSLINNSKGMVVANSTTGLSSVHHNKPTIALSSAVYNFEGLTCQASLSEFWVNPIAPDKEVYKKFRNFVIATTQVDGNFYSEQGIKLAVAGACKRILEAENVNSEITRKELAEV